MESPRRSRKFFWLGLILVFLIGLLGGAYLVLRTTISRGEITNSTALSQGKSSDELLDELLKLNPDQSASSTDEYIPPENKNLTQDFLTTITRTTGDQKIDPKIISSNDFFVSTIYPYLKSNQINLFPIIPDSALVVVPYSKQSSQKYYRDTNKDVVTFFNIMKKISKLDPDNMPSEDKVLEMQADTSQLAVVFEGLAGVEVPEKYLEIHKNILVSVISLQKFLEALTNGENDPLKSLMVINQAGDLGPFWQKAIYDYVQVPENKRK